MRLSAGQKVTLVSNNHSQSEVWSLKAGSWAGDVFCIIILAQFLAQELALPV